ncbi:MAG: hypothetical protein HY280_02545 [Nitrospinae bacterium]|nr:hypothetical protein [Nitrospinota bacterium]
MKEKRKDNLDIFDKLDILDAEIPDHNLRFDTGRVKCENTRSLEGGNAKTPPSKNPGLIIMPDSPVCRSAWLE